MCTVPYLKVKHTIIALTNFSPLRKRSSDRLITTNPKNEAASSGSAHWLPIRGGRAESAVKLTARIALGVVYRAIINEA